MDGGGALFAWTARGHQSEQAERQPARLLGADWQLKGPMAGGSCGSQGRDGTGRCPGDSAGSRALPVSGCGVRRAGGLLGGLRDEWQHG